MPRSIHRCPDCGEPVSQFAAGCAICGTDLQTARAELVERRARLPHTSLPRVGDDALRFGVTVLAVLFAPLLGVLLAGWFAYDADRNGRDTSRNVMVLLFALGAFLLFVPVGIWGGAFAGL